MGSILYQDSTRGTNPVTCLSTALVGLTTSNTATSTSITNDALDLYADFELVSGTTTAVTADNGIELYVIRTVDDTNFEDTSTGGLPRGGYVGLFPFAASLSTQRVIIRQVSLPPTTLFQVMVLNATCYALATSGQIGSPTLKMRAYTEAV